MIAVMDEPTDTAPHGRTLVVTNDYPPRPGGIQSYLESLVERLPPEEVVVYAPPWRGKDAAFDAAREYRVYRHGSRLMVPTASVQRRAAALVRDEGISTVWFGAAAPLALLGPAMRRAGARRIIASTHGHEVGWSMFPASRQVLHRIGSTADVVTYVSDYTKRRFGRAFGAKADLRYLPPGVDTTRFVPDPLARNDVRARHGLGERPVILCLSRLVPRKGQDVLIKAMPAIRRAIPDVALLMVGGGPYRAQLEALVADHRVGEQVTFTGSVPFADLPRYHAAADVFAMPARTRGKGLDVEGFGIVYVEAAACGIPVVAGDSGGAPETVDDGVTGTVVDGREVASVASAIIDILGDPDRAAAMGAAGREQAVAVHDWSRSAERLRAILAG